MVKDGWERSLWSWANALSLSRLVLAPLLVVAITSGRVGAAVTLYALACASDFADGWLARRLDRVSLLGGFLDHASDATFVVCGMGALACQGLVPVLLPPLVICAFAQYAVDSRVIAGRPLRPNPLGRWNGVSYYVLVGTPLIRDALGLPWPGDGLVLAAGWLLTATTLASMVQRARAYWDPHRQPV